MSYPATRELDKVRANKEESRILTQFIDWLSAHGYIILDCERHESISEELVLAKYFDIDLKKVSAEKDLVYEWMQSAEFVVDDTIL